MSKNFLLFTNVKMKFKDITEMELYELTTIKKRNTKSKRKNHGRRRERK